CRNSSGRVQDFRVFRPHRRSRRGDTMKKLTTVAIATFAAFVLSAVALVGASTASAEPKSCAQAHAMAAAYLESAEMYEAYGFYSLASYYYGKAEGVVIGC